ncbi:MAG: Rrf2 family transcriptional regulator [Candidatus Acidiferrales bacterium]
MKASQNGWCALQALTLLAHRFDGKSPTKSYEIATADGLPEKFLEFILLELKHARVVESVRGAKGDYRVKRLPSEIFLGEIICTIDGPLAPFEDAEALRRHVKEYSKHSALSHVLSSVRNAAAGILTAPRLRIFAAHSSSGWATS